MHPATPASPKPGVLKRLAMAVGALALVIGLPVLVLGPIVYFAVRDAEREKPLRESLGPDLQTLHDIIPMLEQGSTNNPLVVTGKVLFLKPDTWIYGPGDKRQPSRWDTVTVQKRALELNPSRIYRLPRERQPTAADIRERKPVTIFVIEEWSTPLGTYGKGGPIAAETQVKVSVVPWPDLKPAHVKEFLMLPPGSVTAKPGGRAIGDQAAELRPAPGQMHYVRWLEQALGTNFSKFETHDWFRRRGNAPNNSTNQ